MISKRAVKLLDFVEQNGGDVTCSMVGVHFYRVRATSAGIVGGAALAKVAAQGYLRRWVECVGSGTVVHYRRTSKVYE